MSDEFCWYSSPQGTPKRLHRIWQILKHPLDLWLIFRILFWAFTLPVLKRIVPLKKLARLMWASSKEIANPYEEEKVVTVVRWIYLFFFPGDGSCLERSLILYRFLSRNNSDPTLVTGMRRTEDQNWKGHAWIVVDGNPFEEPFSSIQDFRELIVFGRNGVMKQKDSIETTR